VTTIGITRTIAPTSTVATTRLAPLFLIASLIGTQSGCTLIGLGIGAVSGGNEEVPRYRVVELPKGTNIEVEYVPSSIRTEPTVSGRFVEADARVLSLDATQIDAPLPPQRRVVIPRASIQRVTELHDSYWKRGLAIGFAIDAAIVLTTFVVCATSGGCAPGVR
jgi:hypothetical protein